MRKVYFDGLIVNVMFNMVTSLIEIDNPQIVPYTVDVPFRDGSLDLTEAIMSRPAFTNRRIHIVFSHIGDQAKRIKTSHRFTNMYLGKKIDVGFSSLDGIYIGRVIEITPNNTEPAVSTIDVVLDCEPFVYDKVQFGERWKWDTFSFVDGVIRPEGNTFDVDGEKTLIIASRTETTPLKVTTNESGMSIRYKGKTFELFKGENVLNKIRLEAKRDNRVTIMGKGRVKVEFRGRRL